MTPRRPPEVAANIALARESFEMAALLAESGHWRGVASRAYYAAFYAASALLAQDGYVTRKHRGVLAVIHRFYVKPGTLDVEQGRALDHLFRLRSMADYAVLSELDAKTARQAMGMADRFVHAVECLIERDQSSDGQTGSSSGPDQADPEESAR